MNVSIQGRVFGIAEDYKSLLLLIEQRDGTKTNRVAVRCWSNTLKERAQQFKNGDEVSVFGKVTSRESKDGRWFTAFEAEGFRLVQQVAAPPRVGSMNMQPEAMAADDDIPF